jgi:ATP-dependent 26S proteasome regulatory subunit
MATKPEALFSSTFAPGSFGGLEKIKQQLHKAVECPVEYPETFLNCGMGAGKGVLFYGPAGTGKILLAQVIANEFQTNLIPIEVCRLALHHSEGGAVDICAGRRAAHDGER